MILKKYVNDDNQVELCVRNNNLILLSQKALYWHEADTLFVSDLHIGKVAHFRKEGFAVPSGLAEGNLRRLDKLISVWSPSRIVFTGDLVHSNANREWNHFIEWRRQYPSVAMHLVPGNHDRKLEEFCTEAGIILENESLEMNPFTISHQPSGVGEDAFLIAGHVHPAVRISGRGQSLRFPCYYLERNMIILPSFGEFTGSFLMEPAPENQIIPIVGNRLMPLPGSLLTEPLQS